ncbi:MAG: ArsR family transcriptional regulator [Rhodospirillales bacterium]|nr:ArsR family transcriptional regulator [Rhodospirillales bacterium]
MTRPDFVYTVYIAASIERVWAALTDGAISREYWGGRQVESDWRVGSPVLFRIDADTYDVVRAKVLAIDPPRHLAMGWTYDLEPVPPASRVTYTLEQASPENVKLTVIHEVWEVGSEVDEGLKNGWPAILSSLKSYLETGKPLDYTKRWEGAACAR